MKPEHAQKNFWFLAGFLKPVVPGDRMEIEVTVLKFVDDFAVVETVATVDETQVAKGKLGFVRCTFENRAPRRSGLPPS